MLPKGFQSTGLACGLKRSGKKDLGLIFSAPGCRCAGVFTQNTIKAHCIGDNQAILAKSRPIHAVIVNAGNANACNGETGKAAIDSLRQALSVNLKVSSDSILTASTGIIGVPLPTEPILTSLGDLQAKLSGEYADFAEAILTTDLKVKVCEISLGEARLVGIAKGSGMIHPNMATMLAFILTDADLSEFDLDASLRAATRKTFNQISVDGDTSTNDMVLLLANGASGYKPNPDSFQQAIEEISSSLAKQIVRDGEGATKLFEVRVANAPDEEEARKIALGIASSSLVKSAIFGGDPNWGRILAAAGRSGAVSLDRLELSLQEVVIWSGGQLQGHDRNGLSQKIRIAEEISIDLSLGEGSAEGKAWGCDLTYDYVRINAEYYT